MQDISRAHPHPEHAGAARERQAWLVVVLVGMMLVGAGGACMAADGTSDGLLPNAPAAGSEGGATQGATPQTGPGGPGTADGVTSMPLAPGVEPSPLRGRQQQLLDEHRRLDGRLRTLDRQLVPYDRDRRRTSPPDQPTSRVRSGQRDPLSERRVLERRNLDYRQRQIESDLRRNP